MSRTVFNEFFFLRTKSNEGEGERGGPKSWSINTQIFYPLLFPKFLQDRHNLGKNKWSRTKIEG